MPTHLTADDFVEVYHTNTTAEAQKILDVILAPQGVEGVIHDRQDHAFIAPSAQAGSVSVAVPFGSREQAILLLQEARAAGYLDETGQIAPAPDAAPDADKS
jgi:hypothetical protein